ncbi:putative ABC transporter ATP-binding protein NosF [Caprobacter fermentans]|uniref:Putative ABC transporter ATP-binding protein NosF n=1 Tax=Caproicibacter fermentans TaxID=2576756 RepID=A0A6N8HXN3_9FIRM|nr:ATP-binding cassette domain-containing protein [Caproicibacter fermentans]MVB10280.1 putative ABC transporter ATP-binding protein NosF [Caproicibacter fermentans]
MNAVEISNMSKVIKGKTILSHINLSLEQGEGYGLYGHNGSGKSMLLRSIAGLIHPTEGIIKVFDKEIGKEISFPESLGLIIESVGFWPYYTGFENLKTLASIKGLISDAEIKHSIKRVGLDPDDKRTYRKYSLGMKQRLGIAQAIMERPDLILLDEPTNALDEDGVELVRTVVREEIDRGATVVIASHNKDDLSLLCSKFFKMNDGILKETEGAQ